MHSLLIVLNLLGLRVKNFLVMNSQKRTPHIQHVHPHMYINVYYNMPCVLNYAHFSLILDDKAGKGDPQKARAFTYQSNYLCNEVQLKV